MAFRDLIFSNRRRKVFSLLLAILVWLTIHFAGRRHQGQGPLQVLPTNGSVNYHP